MVPVFNARNKFVYTSITYFRNLLKCFRFMVKQTFRQTNKNSKNTPLTFSIYNKRKISKILTKNKITKIHILTDLFICIDLMTIRVFEKKILMYFFFINCY